MFLVKKAVIWILTLESKLILRKYRPFIVAVTGSVGKTSTKDAIYDVLKGQSRYVRKVEKSFNSEIGLPLTILGVPNAWRSMSGWWANIKAGLRLITKKCEYPDCLILEIGADHPGDIKKTVKWLHPDIAVITKVSSTPVHVEFFYSPEEVFEEKASLAEAVKAGGTVVLFADDAKVMSIAERVKSHGPRIISYGSNTTAQVRGLNYAVTYSGTGSASVPTGFSFTIESDGESSVVAVAHVLGETFQYPLLAAVAVGKAKGMKLDAIVSSLKAYDAPKGRMNLIQGKNGSTIIDDTYNSSPDAVEAALISLKSIQGNGKGRRIAILGDMMELGRYSADEHRRVGKIAGSIVSRLITVGQRSRATAAEAVVSGLSANSVESFDSADDAIRHMGDIAQPGDLILVKGSQSVRTERIVRALMQKPEEAPAFLVRQEREWLEKP